MKPCYQFEEGLLLLARVTRKQDGSWHLCKAHISRGAVSSAICQVCTQYFATLQMLIAIWLECIVINH